MLSVLFSLSATHHAAEAANYFAVKLLCNANAPVLGENSEVSCGRVTHTCGAVYNYMYNYKAIFSLFV